MAVLFVYILDPVKGKGFYNRNSKLSAKVVNSAEIISSYNINFLNPALFSIELYTGNGIQLLRGEKFFELVN